MGGLEKSVSSLDARVGSLEVVIEERFKHFEKHLEKMETSLTAKLDKIDEDIRGNGKDGINVRLDRLENSKKLTNRWFWVIVSAAVPALISIYLSLGGNFVQLKRTSRHAMADIQKKDGQRRGTRLFWLLMKISKSLKLTLLAAILAQQTSMAQTTPPPEGTVNSPESVLHGRTIIVADKILVALGWRITQYNQVTNLNQLSSVTSLDFANNIIVADGRVGGDGMHAGLSSLQAGDFEGLTNLQTLESASF